MYSRPRMAELADARDSKSRGEIHVGSSPTLGTILKKDHGAAVIFFTLFAEKKRSGRGSAKSKGLFC